jgi:hypothetical protein
MNPWLRVAVVVVGALIGAAFLKVLPPIIVLAAFVLGAFVVTRTLKTRIRRDAVVGQAATLGLRVEPADPFGLLGYPLSLFGRGTDGQIGEVRWGTWRGVEVKAFEYTYAPAIPANVRPAGVGQRGRLWCAIAAIAGAPSRVVAEPVSFVLGLGAHAPMEEVDVPGGRAGFVVRCDDPVFATSLIAGRAGQWLAEGGEAWGFELNGPLLLIYGAAAPSVPELLGRLDDLRLAIAEMPSTGERDPRPAGAA